MGIVSVPPRTVPRIGATLGATFKTREGGGAVIGQVRAGTAAARARLEPGDVILTMDGETIRDPLILRRLVRTFDPTARVDFRIERDGKAFNKTIPLGSTRDLKAHRIGVPHLPATFRHLR